jgi:hypothetical protein
MSHVSFFKSLRYSVERNLPLHRKTLRRPIFSPRESLRELPTKQGGMICYNKALSKPLRASVFLAM